MQQITLLSLFFKLNYYIVVNFTKNPNGEMFAGAY